MLISHSHKFIFVHIYKTAGTSVMDVFAPYARLTDRLVYHYRISRRVVSVLIKIMKWEDDGNRQFTGFHKHATMREIYAKLPPELCNTYFKFAFVRNPFDWVVSLYAYIRGGVNHRSHRDVMRMTFTQFVAWHIEQHPPRQIDFISDTDGRVMVDYVGHFESLADDVHHICDRLGIFYPGVPQLNISNMRRGSGYREYYDSVARAQVEDYFSADLRQWNYSF